MEETKDKKTTTTKSQKYRKQSENHGVGPEDRKKSLWWEMT